MLDLVLVGLIVALAAAFLARRLLRSLSRGRTEGCMLCPCAGQGKPGGRPACLQVNQDSLSQAERERQELTYPECYKHCLDETRPCGCGKGGHGPTAPRPTCPSAPR